MRVRATANRTTRRFTRRERSASGCGGANRRSASLPPPMPIYEYKCPNGHLFEVFHGMTEEGPKACDVCGEGPLQVVLHPVAVHYKGSGFYSTDYGRKAKQPRRTAARATPRPARREAAPAVAAAPTPRAARRRSPPRRRPTPRPARARSPQSPHSRHPLVTCSVRRSRRFPGWVGVRAGVSAAQHVRLSEARARSRSRARTGRSAAAAPTARGTSRSSPGCPRSGCPSPPPPRSPPSRQCTALQSDARNFTQPSCTQLAAVRSVVSGFANEPPVNGIRAGRRAT